MSKEINAKQIILDKNGEQLPLTEIVMLNDKERHRFLDERMNEGSVFNYIKGTLNGHRINVGVTCVETGESFGFVWGPRKNVVNPRVKKKASKRKKTFKTW